MRYNFSNQSLRDVFADKDFSEFNQLMFQTATGTLVDRTAREADDKIREIMFEVLGVDEKCSRKELRKAIRRHKVDVFEVIEETIEDLLVSGWGENPFFNEFVEFRSNKLGDTNEFYTEDDVMLTVSEVSGGHHDIIRQRLGLGKSFSVKTGWLAIKIYTEYELFMAGRVDWASFVRKVYEAFDRKVNSLVYAQLSDIGNKVLPTSQFTKTSALNDTTKATLIELIEDVQAANGTDVVIMGTKSALSKLSALADTAWISDEMKRERNTTGRLGIWEGTRLAEIPQVFADGTTTAKLVRNDMLLVMPVADNKFIKVFDEGEAIITENTDQAKNVDMTYDFEYQHKLGVATIVNRKFGVWYIV